MKKATGEGDGYLDSALVADVIEMAKRDLEVGEVLRKINVALGVTAQCVDSDRALEDIIGVIKGRSNGEDVLRGIAKALNMPPWTAPYTLEQLSAEIEARSKADAERRSISADRFNLIQTLQVAVGGTTHIETVDLACRRSDILDKLMAACGFSESDGVDTAVSVLKYRLAVTERADTIVPDDYPGDTPTYLAECEIAKGKLEEIKKILINYEYDVDEKGILGQMCFLLGVKTNGN